VNEATTSAVIVTVPEAEPAVAVHRLRLDRAARWGVPAHVTVLFPFLPPDDLVPSVLERLAAAVASVPRATTTFARTAWFENDVLWLDPDPPTVFEALTSAVVDAFPGYPPYGGAFDHVVAHLTVGEGAPYADLREAETAVRPHLPVTSDVVSAALWCGSERPDSWTEVRTFPLG
jgi:2'-5' RNA ligase